MQERRGERREGKGKRGEGRIIMSVTDLRFA